MRSKLMPPPGAHGQVGQNTEAGGRGGPTIRTATRADIEAYSSQRGKPSIRAVCMESGGKIIALGGIAYAKGRWIGFCDLTPEARAHKMHIMRAAHRFLAEARRIGIRFIYVGADPNEPGALQWLGSLGFRLDPRSQVLYRWSASSAGKQQ